MSFLHKVRTNSDKTTNEHKEGLKRWFSKVSVQKAIVLPTIALVYPNYELIHHSKEVNALIQQYIFSGCQ